MSDKKDVNLDSGMESDQYDSTPVNEGQVNKIVNSFGVDPGGNKFVNVNEVEIGPDVQKGIEGKIRGGKIRTESGQNLLRQIQPFPTQGEAKYLNSQKRANYINHYDDLKKAFNYALGTENYQKLFILGLNKKNQNGELIPIYNSRTNPIWVKGYRRDGNVEPGYITGYESNEKEEKRRIDMLFYNEDGTSTTKNVSLQKIKELNYPQNDYYKEEIIQALEQKDEEKLIVLNPNSGTIENDWQIVKYEEGLVSVVKYNGQHKFEEQMPIEAFQKYNDIGKDELIFNLKNLNRTTPLTCSVLTNQEVGRIVHFDPNTDKAQVNFIQVKGNHTTIESKDFTLDELNSLKYKGDINQTQVLELLEKYPEPISFVNTMQSYINNAYSLEEQQKRINAIESLVDSVFGKQGEYYRQIKNLFNRNNRMLD